MSEKSRLLWRCRRGIREMDIVFTDFIDQEYDDLSSQQQQDLNALLDEADLDILNWLMGKDEPDSDAFKTLIQLIRESRHLS